MRCVSRKNASRLWSDFNQMFSNANSPLSTLFKTNVIALEDVDVIAEFSVDLLHLFDRHAPNRECRLRPKA